MLTLSLKVFCCSLVVAWLAICFQTFAYNVPDYLLYEDLSDDETVPDDETVSVGDDYAPLYDGDSADDEAPDYNEVLVAEQVLINGEEENPTDNDHFVINGKFETKIGSENNKFLVYYFILKLAIATNKTIGMGCKGTPYDFRQSTPMQKVTDKFGLEEIIYRIYDGLELEKEEFDSLQLFVKAKR